MYNGDGDEKEGVISVHREVMCVWDERKVSRESVES
jgi:hypothetical protein